MAELHVCETAVTSATAERDLRVSEQNEALQKCGVDATCTVPGHTIVAKKGMETFKSEILCMAAANPLFSQVVDLFQAHIEEPKEWPTPASSFGAPKSVSPGLPLTQVPNNNVFSDVYSQAGRWCGDGAMEANPEIDILSSDSLFSDGSGDGVLMAAVSELKRGDQEEPTSDAARQQNKKAATETSRKAAEAVANVADTNAGSVLPAGTLPASG